MVKRRLGRSELMVSPMGLGCWAIGGPWTFEGEPAGWGRVDDAESIRAIHCALDLGIDLFDTAANYGCGHSERVLGRALDGRRSRVILATKFGYAIDEKARNVEPAKAIVGRIRQECEASLGWLGTDYIDFYQLHVNDLDPQGAEGVCQVLESLVDQGKIRWYGWSTNNPDGARAFARGAHCAAIQHTLNMIVYRPEILAACEECDLGSINRYPLASGLLTGKFTPDTVFPEDDFRHDFDLRRGSEAKSLLQAATIREAFAGGQRTLAQIALGWIWGVSGRTVPIPGFRTVEQVRENVGAMAFGPLSSEDMHTVETIFGRKPRAG